ncbi:TPA: DNA mismatch endonuclease Vsr [Candidatus Poribacteria bacterium]|nr:DNA mismatch endonuclease Vsr [Candidatus Poribacteria bacterium]HIA67244.1 DNA mismatch endonuclease Vsr [Candidatus Poribacteria bacterium]
MTDIFSKQKRSQIMSRIRSKGSAPEMLVRRVIHRLGYRFRLHVKNLPGKPDLVLKRHKLIVLVNGCFWHRHQGCKRSTTPKSNQEYWIPKFEGNVTRDLKNQKALREMGWRVETIWECETKDWNKLTARLSEVFDHTDDFKKALQRLEDLEIMETVGKMQSGRKQRRRWPSGCSLSSFKPILIGHNLS